ncbi:hypothetical protein [Paenarthrobacter sp. YJN-5]|uniref:hypothetical protein n=1 Tax=Paenarthrobacter sp. YJN-5 TaxID=2735316 RepID=UPI001878AB83|nr:hypothetical protein [Paenarthrobacter sp. YJN-5]QOT19439.1 hypothetical protein HMI59_22585 [Paenarthrobacter sp. YJN-5]
MTTMYFLDLGFSPDGDAVHPVDRLGTLPSLDAAKAAAEQEAGKPLQWRWMEGRQVWRAELSYQQAAEISVGTRVERVNVAAGLMG